MRLQRTFGLVLAIAGFASACAIQPEAAPSDIPAERTGVFGEPVTGDEAAGTNRIYLLAPRADEEPQRLRSVLRDVPTNASSILGSLFAGPNAAERTAQLDTAIPSDAEVLSTRTVGQVLTIDMNDVFDELTPEGLRLAVGQIVTSATEIDGVSAVQLRIEGEPRVWPLGNGQLSDRALTAFDYPGLVESSQPAFPGIPSPPPA
ncbi:MAG TPA: GerMN domain-containing protein [Ilumatobacteraceae bacterium]|nr:GerMN domain-containing protein [Ilumatobacteraceae bacterium]